jgi:hypothetical protein
MKMNHCTLGSIIGPQSIVDLNKLRIFRTYLIKYRLINDFHGTWNI